MAAGDMKIGLDGKFYHGAAGTPAATEADNVTNCSINLSAITAQALRRGKLWQMTKVIALQATLSFQIYDREGDAFFAAVKTAFLGRSRIALWPTDGVGGDGLDADYYITSFTRDENNEEFITYNVEAAPTDEMRDPEWNTKAAA